MGARNANVRKLEAKLNLTGFGSSYSSLLYLNSCIYLSYDNDSICYMIVPRYLSNTVTAQR